MTRHSLLLTLALIASACQADATPPAPAPSFAPASASAPGPASATSPGPVSEASASSRPPAFDVGKGIGPVRLGMRREELDGLGLPVSQRRHDLVVGPYAVVLDQGVVVFIAVQLAELLDGLTVGGALVRSGDRDIEAIAKRLPDCGELEASLGGNRIACAGGTVILTASGPPGLLELRLMTTPSVASKVW